MTDDFFERSPADSPHSNTIIVLQNEVEEYEAALVRIQQLAAESRHDITLMLETMREQARMWREAYRAIHNYRAVQRDLKTWLGLANRELFWNMVRQDPVFKKEQADFATYCERMLMLDLSRTLGTQLLAWEAAVCSAKTNLELARVELARALVTASEECLLADGTRKEAHRVEERTSG